jgi:hypothetical protein
MPPLSRLLSAPASASRRRLIFFFISMPRFLLLAAAATFSFFTRRLFSLDAFHFRHFIFIISRSPRLSD